MTGDDGQELRALALQTTAEMWRGLDVMDLELKQCRLASARDTIRQIRAIVKMADEAIIVLTREHWEATRTQAPGREQTIEIIHRAICYDSPQECIEEMGQCVKAALAIEEAAA